MVLRRGKSGLNVGEKWRRGLKIGGGEGEKKKYDLEKKSGGNSRIVAKIKME